MKKTLIFSAIALVAFAACTKTEPASEIANQEINFQVANYAEGTKAGASKLGLNESFGVFAYYNTVAWSSGNTSSVYMNGVEIKHADNGDATDWAPETKYYWPKTGKLTFVGWAPFGKTPTFTKAAGITWTNFTLPLAPGNDNKVDLMYSDVASDKEANVTGTTHTGVPMLFHHALAQLNFNLEYDMSSLQPAQKSLFKIQVTKITLNQLGKTATYTNGAWGTPSAAGDQQLAATSNELKSTSATQTGYVTDYYIIPQAPVQITVEYKVNGIAATASTFTLATSAISSWQKNYIYTYNLKISPVKDGPEDNPITFDPTVQAWDTTKPTQDVTL